MNANHIAMTLALLAVTSSASAASTSTSSQAAAHGQQHHAHATSAEAPVKTQRWAVDAALQSGIGKIRAAVERIGQTGKKAPTRAEVVQLASEIEAQVRFLIEHCKLEPEADAALHTIIGRLLSAVGTLKANPDATTAAAAQLRAALSDYPKYFDDPRWRPLAD